VYVIGRVAGTGTAAAESGRAAQDRPDLEDRMRWFHDRSTLAKLLGTFAVLCAVMGIVGYLGVNTAQAIKADVDNATGNLLPSALAAAAIDGSLNDVRVNVRSATMTSDAKQTAQFVQTATDAFTEAEKQ
jgi:hypothetical protein